MAPFTALLHPGTLVYFLVYLLIGMGFGTILEMSGFGDSRKLAAQFYFKDMTVLKVMFTGIVVACMFIFLSSSLGWLNYDKIWVNPTYLWPEIVGGLIMGVGFIVGGFCPGTSVVAAATLKLDGIIFVLGGLFGVWAFGESVGSFEGFFLLLLLWSLDPLRLAGNCPWSRGFVGDPHGLGHVLFSRNRRSLFWRTETGNLLAPPELPKNVGRGPAGNRLQLHTSDWSTLTRGKVGLLTE